MGCGFLTYTPSPIQASSSIGRVPVSKTGGCGFDSYLACLKGDAVRKGGVLAVKNKE